MGSEAVQGNGSDVAAEGVGAEVLFEPGGHLTSPVSVAEATEKISQGLDDRTGEKAKALQQFNNFAEGHHNYPKFLAGLDTKSQVQEPHGGWVDGDFYGEYSRRPNGDLENYRYHGDIDRDKNPTVPIFSAGFGKRRQSHPLGGRFGGREDFTIIHNSTYHKERRSRLENMGVVSGGRPIFCKDDLFNSSGEMMLEFLRNGKHFPDRVFVMKPSEHGVTFVSLESVPEDGFGQGRVGNNTESAFVLSDSFKGNPEALGILHQQLACMTMHAVGAVQEQDVASKRASAQLEVGDAGIVDGLKIEPKTTEDLTALVRPNVYDAVKDRWIDTGILTDEIIDSLDSSQQEVMAALVLLFKNHPDLTDQGMCVFGAEQSGIAQVLNTKVATRDEVILAKHQTEKQTNETELE